jgi:hypothetical protein
MVDLSKGTQGRIKFRNGEEWWCPDISPVESRLFTIRYEHGWHAEYSRDGINLQWGIILKDGKQIGETPPNHDRDVVEFEPCEWDGILPTGVNP